MKTVIGKIVKEEFVNDEWYFVDVPFEGSIFIDTDKFTDVDKYIGEVIECETIVWNHMEKGSNKYKVVGKVN